MNKDMINRLKTATGYQKKAILALLPESTASHLEVIGKEMKQMFAELMINGIAGAAKQDTELAFSASNGAGSTGGIDRIMATDRFIGTKVFVLKAHLIQKGFDLLFELQC